MNGNNSWIFLLAIIGAFGLICLGVFLFKKFYFDKKTNLIKKDEVKIDEEKALSEELDRILEPIEDDEIVEQMEKYGDKEGKK